jgi:DNA-binding transcriptional ArsR family regulator
LTLFSGGPVLSPWRREPKNLGTLWHALGDPTRPAILELLRDRLGTTGELATHFPSTRFAIMKHLSVLEAVGRVVVRRNGQERWNHLNAAPGDCFMSVGSSPIRRCGLMELEIEIAAPPERVWKSLVEETAFWWPREYYANPEAQAFRIEPRLGGLIYEDWGNGDGLV